MKDILTDDLKPLQRKFLIVSVNAASELAR